MHTYKYNTNIFNRECSIKALAMAELSCLIFTLRSMNPATTLDFIILIIILERRKKKSVREVRDRSESRALRAD